MGKAVEPLDMLRKCRAEFDFRAKRARKREGKAKTTAEREDASAFAEINERFVSGIDETLRDWA